MRYRQQIVKLVSILMLFVLMQKIAGGLYIHNWLHGSKNAPVLVHSCKTVSQYNCNCIDDFYVPLTEAVMFNIDLPLFAPSERITIKEQELPVTSTYFSSLRGPPRHNF